MFDMGVPKDTEAWDYLNEISKSNVDSFLVGVVEDMLKELQKIEAQILTIEKQRLSNLKDKVLRKQCREILDGLRKERDGLRKTLGSETYKRVVASLR